MGYAFNFGVVWANAGLFLHGLAVGLGLAVASLSVGTAIGLVCAFAGTARQSWVRRLVAGYVTAIRNTPLLVIVLFAYFALPRLGLRLGKEESFIASLSLYAGAYLTEVFRSGLAGVPHGVVDAGKALGLSRLQRARLVVLPIVIRNVLPSLGTTFISLFKDTSIAATIAVQELTFVARKINTETFRVAEVWLAATTLYVLTCLLLAAGLRWLERRYPKF